MYDAFDVLPCGYVAFTDDGTIRACNLALTEWLKYSKEELNGKQVDSVLTLASRIFYNTHLFPLIRLHGNAYEVFITLQDKDGQDVPVLINARRVETPQNIIHSVLIRVEERKKFERELIEARRHAENAVRENKHLAELTRSLERHTIELEKQYQHQMLMNEDLLQFSKIISHDLQEPIHKIQVFNDLIVRDADSTLSSRSRRFSSRINTAASRLKQLTSTLDEYISIDKVQDPIQVDLNRLIQKAQDRAADVRQFYDFDIRIESLPVVEGSESQLELLFYNLIDNAIQFREPSRKLEITITHVVFAENVFRISKDHYRYKDHLRIIFEDNGKGFPEEYTKYVFILLKKVHSSTGPGMGLPVVRKIVQNHFGEIRVNSHLGNGTRFEIEIPLMQSH